MDESLGLGDSSERKFMNNVTYLYGKTVPDKSKPIFQIYFNSGLVDEEGFFLIPGTRFYIQAINHIKQKIRKTSAEMLIYNL